jgi:transposase
MAERWTDGKRQGAPKLEDRPRSGRTKEISPEQEAALVEATLHTSPERRDPLECPFHGENAGGQSRHRATHLEETSPPAPSGGDLKIQHRPHFLAKVRDIVGLYLNPPDQAIVLSVDEKSQIQALDRTQPILPLRPGLPERQTHDYHRHGPTTLFAALHVAAGKIIAQCQPRYRHQEFLRFLKQIDTATPPTLDIHMILDNYGTHKHPQGRKWFNANPRYHVHFTPTSASWLNQVERWFAEITRKRIRRGSFHSVRDLVQAIQEYIRENNKNPRPFQWVASANTMVRKVRKYKWTLATGD